MAKADDLLLISGATEYNNNAIFQVSSLTATAITVKVQGNAGKMTDDTTDPCVISFFTPIDDLYSYDLENHRFSLPNSAKKLMNIYEGNITDRLEAKSTQHTVDNDDLDVYSEISRNVYSLAEDLFTGAGNILTFKVKRDLVAPQSAYRAAEIDIPQAFEQALKKGVLADLLSLPKYSNSDLLKDQRALYQGALVELFGSEGERNRTTFFEKDYVW